MLIDTHAHLYWEDYKQDFDEVIQRSLDASVTTIINVGVDVEKSKQALRLAQRINGERSQTIKFYSTIGIHPHEAVKYSADPSVSIHQDIEKLEQVYQTNTEKVVAVGECGLDYYFRELDPSVADSKSHLDSSPPQDDTRALQRQLFQAQIDLAKKLNLPLIVHCRDDRSKDPQNSEAWDEVLEMVSSHYGILHCYSGLPPTTQKAMNSNFLVSFAATITYPKNEYLREAVKILPLEKIVLETDCPFLPPQSKRGQRNEPANVLEIAQLIAEIKDIHLEEVENKTSENVRKILRLREV